MRFLLLILLLPGCAWQDVLPPEPEPEPELIVVELPEAQLKYFCGAWSGKGGCVWQGHKFVLKPEVVSL